MSDIHDRARALAIRMLAPRPAGKGFQISLIRKDGPPALDPAQGTVVQPTATEDGSGLREEYDASMVDGAIIQQKDLKIILSPVKLDGTDITPPVTSDKLVMVDETVTVINVSAWNYAGVACGYEIQARRS